MTLAIELGSGQTAYEAYIASCPVSKFTGEKLPAWDAVDPDIKRHWAAAEKAAHQALIEHIKWRVGVLNGDGEFKSVERK